MRSLMEKRKIQVSALKNAMNKVDFQRVQQILKTIDYDCHSFLIQNAVVDVNKVDIEGRTLLHHAALNDDVKAIGLLLQLGADATIRDREKNTALDYALHHRHTDAAKTLITNTTGRVCLHGISYQNAAIQTLASLLEDNIVIDELILGEWLARPKRSEGFYQLSDESLQVLIANITPENKLHTLKIAYQQGLTEAGLNGLEAASRNSPQLKNLDLSDVKYIAVETYQAVLRSLRANNREIEHLRLNHSPHCQAILPDLVDLIRETTSLIRLDLEFNRFTFSEMKQIFQAIKDNYLSNISDGRYAGIVELHILNDNSTQYQFSHEEWQELIAIITEIKSLRVLNLRHLIHAGNIEPVAELMDQRPELFVMTAYPAKSEDNDSNILARLNSFITQGNRVKYLEVQGSQLIIDDIKNIISTLLYLPHHLQSLRLLKASGDTHELSYYQEIINKLVKQQLRVSRLADAIKRGDLAYLQRKIFAYADFNRVNAPGSDSLEQVVLSMKSSDENQISIELLLAGLPVELLDAQMRAHTGKSLLLHAVENRQIGITRWLLSNYYRLTEGSYSHTHVLEVLEYARKEKLSSLAELLESYLAMSELDIESDTNTLVLSTELPAFSLLNRIRMNDPSLDKLSVEYLGLPLTESRMRTLRQSLNRNTHIHKLYWGSDSELVSTHLAILQSLKAHPNIRSLHFNGHTFPFAWVNTIGEFLVRINHSNSGIRELKLSHCRFTPEAFACLLKHIKKSTSLKQLDLSGCQLSSAQLLTLAKALESKTLTYLDLSGNQFNRESIAAITNTCKDNYVLRTLKLNHINSNEIIGATAAWNDLFKALPTSLLAIEISGNSIQNISSEVICPHAGARIDLSNNLIIDDVFYDLMRAIAQYGKIFRQLDFSYNSITATGLQQCISRISEVRSFVQECKLKQDDCKSFELTSQQFSAWLCDNNYTFFLRKIEQGEINTIRKLLLSRLDINEQHTFIMPDGTQSCVSPLMLACIYGQEEIAKLLMHRGASIDELTDNGKSLLHLAAEFSPSLIVDLFSYGLSLNTQDMHGNTALHQAVLSNMLEAVQILLDLGADTGVLNRQGKTAIALAAEHGFADIKFQLSELSRLFQSVELDQLDKIQGLITDIEQARQIRNIQGENLLECAIRSDSINVASWLVQHVGFAIDVVNHPSENTPLEQAVNSGDAALVAGLLQANSQKHLDSQVVKQAWQQAHRSKHPQIRDLLAQHIQIPLHIRAYDKLLEQSSSSSQAARDALHEFLQDYPGFERSIRGSQPISEWLDLLKEVDYRKCNTTKKGQLPLVLLIDGLLTHKHDVTDEHLQNIEQVIPIYINETEEHLLAINCNFIIHRALQIEPAVIAIVKLLIESGRFSLHFIDHMGRSPLHYAVIGCEWELIEILLLLGCRPDIKDKYGKSAFDYANQDITVRMQQTLQPELLIKTLVGILENTLPDATMLSILVENINGLLAQMNDEITFARASMQRQERGNPITANVVHRAMHKSVSRYRPQKLASALMQQSTIFNKRGNASSIANTDNWYTDVQITDLLEHLLNQSEQEQFIMPLEAHHRDFRTILSNCLARAMTNLQDESSANQELVIYVPIRINSNHWVGVMICTYDDAYFNPVIHYIDPKAGSLPGVISDALMNIFPELCLSNIIVNTIAYQAANDGENCGPWLVRIFEHYHNHGRFPEENEYAVNSIREEHQTILSNMNTMTDDTVHRVASNRR